MTLKNATGWRLTSETLTMTVLVSPLSPRGHIYSPNLIRVETSYSTTRWLDRAVASKILPFREEANSLNTATTFSDEWLK